jgi:hypothetical protein
MIDTVISDRPKTFSAEYLAENYRNNISAETNIRQVLTKTKKVLFSNFPFQSHFLGKVFFLLTLSMLYACIRSMFLLPINQQEFATATLEKKILLQI